VDNQIRQKLQQLFSQFNQEEEGVSSFAMNNLLDRTLKILQAGASEPDIKKVKDRESNN